MEDAEPRLCRYCERDATHACSRCGSACCDEHGRDLCQACLAPESALPSGTVFRGSLVALVVAALVAIWLLIKPPTLPGERRLAQAQGQNPAAVQPSRGRAGANNAAVPTPLPTEAVNPTPAAARSYTVLSGDTLSGIANSFGSTVAEIEAANPGVTPANLKAGQELIIPPPGGFPTPTPTPSPTPSPSPTATASPTATPAPTETPSPSPTATPAATATPTATPTPASTPSPTPTPAG